MVLDLSTAMFRKYTFIIWLLKNFVPYIQAM